jgi:hypothetical protein
MEQADVTPPPVTRAHRRFLTTDRKMVETFGDPFRPLEPECKVVQFDRPLKPTELQKAAEILRGRPDVELYVYGNASRDLDFLEYFEGLRRLDLALYELEDIAGFSHLHGGLEELTFGQTRRTFSLRFLATLPQLTRLFLRKHSNDLAAIQTLGRLDRLGLSGITLPDLAIIVPLTKLRDLSIFLGATRNLQLLPRLPELERLFLMRITKMSDLGVLADLAGLRSLRLDWMRNVNSLPSFSRLSRLENVELDTMKGLTDLSPIAAAPALRRLSIAAMPQLSAESFRCLIGHPRLAELWAYTGRRAANDAVKQMFPGIAR